MTMKEIRRETTTVRIYGRDTTRWWCNSRSGEAKVLEGRLELRYLNGWRLEQYEKPYVAYRLNGEIAACGSRDFQPSKGSMGLREWWVWTWDGERRQAGGKKWWMCKGVVTTDASTRASDMKEVLRAAGLMGCGSAVEIDLRTR